MSDDINSTNPEFSYLALKLVGSLCNSLKSAITGSKMEEEILVFTNSTPNLVSY